MQQHTSANEKQFSIFTKTSFFNSAELLGIIAGIVLIVYPINFSLRQSVIYTLLLAAVPAVGILYLIDRNNQYL